MEMRNEKARRNILNKISLAQPIQLIKKEREDKYADLFPTPPDEIELTFAKEFNKLEGNFIYCENEEECFNKISKIALEYKWEKIYCRENTLLQKLDVFDLTNFITSDLINAQVALTTCDLLIARTGSIAVSSLGMGDRLSSIFTPIHICIAYNYQVVRDISDALSFLKKKHQVGDIAEHPSFFSLITGPSKTADIEKTLVKGVHGPEDVFVFFIDQ